MRLYASKQFGTDASAGGWLNNDTYPREVADVNGDGRADIVGFGGSGVRVAFGQIDGSFGSSQFVMANFSKDTYNWSSNDEVPRKLGDINGDGRADIIGFAREGVYTALGKSDGTFATPKYVLTNFSVDKFNWSSDDLVPRELGDVNGDGRADIVGFAREGVYTALGKTDGTFETPHYALANFGVNAFNWASNDLVPRELGDVNGDGRADIVGFAREGVYVALGQSDGTFFGQSPFLASKNFGANAGAGGWVSNDMYPRELGDVNGDGRADIVGFGFAGVQVALGQPDGSFGVSRTVLEAFGPDSRLDGGGWNSNVIYPRQVADVNGDGRADIIGFKDNGVYTAFGTASGIFV